MFIRNQKGMSLIEVIIAMGLLGIVGSVFSSMMFSQQRQIKFLEAKQEIVDLKNVLNRKFSGSLGFCPLAINSVGDIKFPILTVPSEISVNKIFDTAATPFISTTSGVSGSALLNVEIIKILNFSGASNHYTGDVSIQFKLKNSNSVAIRPTIISSISFVTQTDPDDVTKQQVTNCEVGGGAANPFGEISKYPAGCYIEFGHQDDTRPIDYLQYQTDKPGLKGLMLSGVVDSNDKLFVGGNCTSSDPTSLEAYFSSCSFDIGHRDTTNNGNVALNSTPAVFATHSMNSSSRQSINLSGDVDDNDSFYFRTRCPAPTAQQTDAAQYLKSNCHICFGYSDIYRPQPDVKVCSTFNDISDASWTRFRLTGRVDSNDTIFLGFYCKGTADTVYSIQ